MIFSEVVCLRSMRWTKDTWATVAMALLAFVLVPNSNALRCRDRLKQPFSPDSIWNTPIGSGAIFVPAALYVAPGPSPSPGTGDVCKVGKEEPSTRTVCSAWRTGWNESQCLAAGCCYDPHPNPDPAHYAWCYENATTSGDGGPDRFCGSCYLPHCIVDVGKGGEAGAKLTNPPDVDIDYFIVASKEDPETVFVNQGWWGSDPECGRDHCCRKSTSVEVGTVPFPLNWTVNMIEQRCRATASGQRNPRPISALSPLCPRISSTLAAFLAP